MEFDELYKEIILDHYRHPRNAAVLDDVPDEQLHENPTCGDSIKLALSVAPDGKVEQVRFEGSGCAMSMASASMMTELLAGKSVEEAKETIDAFIRVMTGQESPDTLEEWDDLAAFRGVIQYPVRVKCVTLAWHAARDRLEG